MRNSPVKIFWECPACGKETIVLAIPIIPAQTYGPPENCYPQEGGEIEPTQCECGREIDADDVQERAAEKTQDFYED
jgi:hypothetical protein